MPPSPTPVSWAQVPVVQAGPPEGKRQKGLHWDAIPPSVNGALLMQVEPRVQSFTYMQLPSFATAPGAMQVEPFWVRKHASVVAVPHVFWSSTSQVGEQKIGRSLLPANPTWSEHWVPAVRQSVLVRQGLAHFPLMQTRPFTQAFAFAQLPPSTDAPAVAQRRCTPEPGLA